MSIQQNKIRDIIEKIWSKVKEPKPMSGDGIVDAIDEVYATGEDNGIAEFWNGLFQNGNSTYMRDKFAYTKINSKIFRPPFTIKPTGANSKDLFYGCEADEPIDCIALEEELGYPIFDFSECINMEYQFSNCTAFSRLGVIDMSNVTYSNIQTLYNCTAKYVKKIIVSEKTLYNNTFRYFRNIEHCPFEGVIAQNGVDFTQSTKLDKESLLSVITCLADKTADTSGTVWKVTFGATNLAKLTDTEKAEIEAKGWAYA